jgi:hypothetical protein
MISEIDGILQARAAYSAIDPRAEKAHACVDVCMYVSMCMSAHVASCPGMSAFLHMYDVCLDVCMSKGMSG